MEGRTRVTAADSTRLAGSKRAEESARLAERREKAALAARKNSLSLQLLAAALRRLSETSDRTSDTGYQLTDRGRGHSAARSSICPNTDLTYCYYPY